MLDRTQAQATMAVILRTENLHKKFGGVHATRDLNLTVHEHQLHAVIGPNGAGKTTLVAQLCGALRPDAGRVHFAERDITRLSYHQRARIGLARSFQITNVIAAMTLVENVMLAVQATDTHSPSSFPHKFFSPRFFSRVSQDHDLRARAIHYLRQVGLDTRADVIATTAAHGEQRRLELAMALALKPRLLLLDEPLAGMSGEESAQMITLLQNIKGKISILLIEHDMQAVFALADTTSVLVKGHLIATGNSASICANAEVQRAYLGGNEP